MAERRGFELMAIAAWRPRIEPFRHGILNVTGQARGANYDMQFSRKPQISLAFGPQESNGRDVLKGAQAPAG